jgi:hypothetical protein
MLEVGDVISFPNQWLISCPPRSWPSASLGSDCIAECVKVDLEKHASWGRPAYLFMALVSYSPIYELDGCPNKQIGW